MKLKTLVLALSLASGLGAISVAHANADLAKAKNCLACHAADKKLVGPAYKEVAKKYAGDKTAEAKLAKKIREGGTGVWGQVAMPANPQVNADDAVKLAKWILATK